MKMLNKKLIYSASMLQDYIDCPRRFELKYILKQLWPSIPVEPIQEFEENLQRGRQFHFLIHQFFAGVPSTIIRDNVQNSTLLRWFDQFVDYFKNLSFIETHSEIQLSASLHAHKLIAIFDLIMLSENNQIIIFDWKTYLHSPKPEIMIKKMQSSIYPYILFGNLKQLFPSIKSIQNPEISMIYWFPEFPDSPITFDYDTVDNEEISQSLTKLLNEIDEKSSKSDFHLTKNIKYCKYCQYRSLCERGISAGNIRDAEPDQPIEEITIDFDSLPSIEMEI